MRENEVMEAVAFLKRSGVVLTIDGKPAEDKDIRKLAKDFERYAVENKREVMRSLRENRTK